MGNSLPGVYADTGVQNDDLYSDEEQEIDPNFVAGRMSFVPRRHAPFKKCGYRSTGLKCFRKVVVDTDRCVYHPIVKVPEIPQNIQKYNTECPICLDVFETEIPIYNNVCGHLFHYDCIKDVIKMECPVCRGDLVDLPDHIAEAINNRGAQNRRSTESNDFRNLISSITGDGSLLSSLSRDGRISIPTDIGNLFGTFREDRNGQIPIVNFVTNAVAAFNIPDEQGTSISDIIQDENGDNNEDGETIDEATHLVLGESMEAFRARYVPPDYGPINMDLIQNMVRNMLPVAMQTMATLRNSQNQS